MSPEQVRGQRVDHRTDLFSLGAVLYEMLSGRRPFQGGSPAETMSAILRDEPPPLTAAHADLSPALERIVRRCLEKDPEARFQSAPDLAFALETLAEGALRTDMAAAGAPGRSSGGCRPSRRGG